YGTGLALAALAAAGAGASAPARRAAAWLDAHQNADGGWGETCATYDQPQLRGCGPSTASQTAWALLGLMAARESADDAVQRGIDYLVRTQAQDGVWHEDLWTGTGFPKVFYLRYDLYRAYFPLLALAHYHTRTRGDRP
ncbi:MAG: squalene--hopene cyclase, partial [Anaerolineae bacterium]